MSETIARTALCSMVRDHCRPERFGTLDGESRRMLALRLEQPLVDSIDRMADEFGISRSAMIRLALDVVLGAHARATSPRPGSSPQ